MNEETRPAQPERPYRQRPGGRPERDGPGGHPGGGLLRGFHQPRLQDAGRGHALQGLPGRKAEDLIPTLEEAFRQSVPSVIVVPVDYSENMKLSAHLKEVCRKE